MADEITTTIVTELIPELIESRVLDAVKRRQIFWPIIGEENKINMGTVGKVTNVAQIVEVDLAATTEGVAPSNTAFNPTDRQLTVATYGAKFFIPWEARQYSGVDPADLVSRAVAIAAVKLEDTDSTGFAGLYAEAPTSGPDHTIGVSGTNMTAALVRSGKELLLTQNADDEVHHVIASTQWGHLMQDNDAKQWLKQTRDGALQMAVTRGVQPDRYLGQVYGVNEYVANGMISSSGLHSIMWANGAIGCGYKLIATETSPTPSRVNVSLRWDDEAFGWHVNIRMIHDISGLCFSASTNKWLVDIIT